MSAAKSRRSPNARCAASSTSRQSFRRRVALLKGLPESALQQVVDAIPLTDGAERLVATLRRLGYKTAILSGGFTFFGRVLQERLGIDHLQANTLEIRDGLVTGEVVPPIVDGAMKADCLEKIAAEEGLSLEQCIAVGDGANDLPMLRLAGLGIAFRAKPIVRSSAGPVDFGDGPRRHPVSDWRPRSRRRRVTRGLRAGVKPLRKAAAAVACSTAGRVLECPCDVQD